MGANVPQPHASSPFHPWVGGRGGFYVTTSGGVGYGRSVSHQCSGEGWLEFLQWNFDLTKCQRTGPIMIGLLHQGFVIWRTLL